MRFRLVRIVLSTLISTIDNKIDNKKGRMVLNKNCKIGAHSVIMPGVTIGENSIIGAFSFVNKNIPANVVAYGIPVKIIRKI